MIKFIILLTSSTLILTNYSFVFWEQSNINNYSNQKIISKAQRDFVEKKISKWNTKKVDQLIQKIDKVKSNPKISIKYKNFLSEIRLILSSKSEQLKKRTIEDLKIKVKKFIANIQIINWFKEYYSNWVVYILESSNESQINLNYLSLYFERPDINKSLLYRYWNSYYLSSNYEFIKKPNLEDLKSKVKEIIEINSSDEFNENWKIYIAQNIRKIPVNINNIYPLFKKYNLYDYYLYKTGEYYSIWNKLDKIESAKSYDIVTLEKMMLEKINVLRKNNWVNLLTINHKLSNSAQFHAADMSKNYFFAHQSLNWDHVRDRAEKFWYSYGYIWENITKWQINIDAAMNSWINSPPHKANLLNPDFKEFWLWFSNYYWVQNFGSSK